MKNIFFLLLTSLFIISCSTKNDEPDMIEISMDIENRSILDIDLSQCDTIILENIPQALMFSIDDIVFGENEICVQGKNKVSLFKYDGTYIKDLGMNGRGPAEYLRIGNIFLKDNMYCIYDSQSGKILKFSTSGNFVEYETLPSDPDIAINKLAPFEKSSNYIAANTFRGFPDETPDISIYNSSFKNIASSERKLAYGSHIMIPFHVWRDEALYTAMICDTIYSATSEGVIFPKYHLNFGKQTLPGAINGSSNPFDRIEYWFNNGNESRYSAILNPVIQDDDNLYIPYGYKDGYKLLCYNKQTGNSQAFRLWNPITQKITQFKEFKIHKDFAYFILGTNNENTDNPLIIKVKSKIFKL